MKRLIGLTIVAALLTGLPVAHHTIAAGPTVEVTVCDVNLSFERKNGIVFVMGMLKVIPAEDLPAALASGDVEITGTPPTPPACCAFSVLVNGNIVAGQID